MTGARTPNLGWPGCRNARDVGGLPAEDGSAIRFGALLRSGHHGDLTPAATETIRAAGISRIIDLRRDRELAEHPSPFAADPVYHHAPVLLDVVTYEYPDDSYGPLLDHNRERLAAAFRAIAAAPPGPVLVHCRGGRDRTGVVVAVALAVAGVPADVIAEDYARTENSPAAVMLNTLDHVERTYGGVHAYLKETGVSDAEIDAVRNRLREPAFLTETRTGYDRFAAEYADLFRDWLADKIWDRAVLGGLAELVHAEPGPVLEAGSGTGEVTAYLKKLDLDVTGFDLSPEMVAIARRTHPDLTFETASMTAIPHQDAAFAAVVAWYSTIHIPDEELPTVLAEFRRVLRPGGYVALAFQVGEEAKAVRDIMFRRRPPGQVTGLLTAAGFEMTVETVRAAGREGVAESLPQAYLVARKPLAQ